MWHRHTPPLPPPPQPPLEPSPSAGVSLARASTITETDEELTLLPHGGEAAHLDLGRGRGSSTAGSCQPRGGWAQVPLPAALPP